MALLHIPVMVLHRFSIWSTSILNNGGRRKTPRHLEETNSSDGKAVVDGDNTDIDIDLETHGEEHGYPLDVEVLKKITPKC